jgi:hypothetical protein
MKEINEILKKNDIRTRGYQKIGKVIIADTNIGKLAIKENKDKDYIYNYLNTRSFNYYPEIIESEEYVISKYIEDIDIPKEQKILDLIDLVSLMHSKTTHYKEVSVDEYKKIYEDLSNNFEYLSEYYYFRHIHRLRHCHADQMGKNPQIYHDPGPARRQQQY